MSRLAQLQSLVKTLPPSPFRNRGAPQLSDAIESILSRHFPESSTSSASATMGQAGPSTLPKSGAARNRLRLQEEERKISEARKEDAVEGMIRSLQRIQANAAAEKYPLSDRILQPSHDPNTYLRIYNGVHRSVEGKARAWWKRFFQVRGKE